jgi:hypothetical protein
MLVEKKKGSSPPPIFPAHHQQERENPCQFESIGRTPISIRKKGGGRKKGYPPFFFKYIK